MAFDEIKMSDLDKFIAELTREFMLKIKESKATEQDVLDYFDKLDEIYCGVYDLEPIQTILFEFKENDVGETQGAYDKYDNKIKLSKKFIENCIAGKTNFSEVLCVWGHEYGHRIQQELASRYDNMSIAEQDDLGEYVRDVVSSIKKVRLNFKSFEYMINAMRPYLSERHIEFFKTASKKDVEDFFKNLWFSYYAQQKEEEQARDIGFKFASKLLQFVTLLPDTTEQDKNWIAGQMLSEDEYVSDYKLEYYFYQQFIDAYKKLDVISLINIEKIIDDDYKKFEDEKDALDFRNQSLIVYRNVLDDLLKGRSIEDFEDYFMLGVKTACPVLADVALKNLEHEVQKSGKDINLLSNKLVFELVNGDSLTEKVFSVDFGKFLTTEQYGEIFDGLFKRKRIVYVKSMIYSMIGQINKLEKGQSVEAYKTLYAMVEDFVLEYGEEMIESMNSNNPNFPYFDYKEYLDLVSKVIEIGKYVNEDYADLRDVHESIKKDEWRYEEMCIPDEVRNEIVQEAMNAGVSITEIDKYMQEKFDEYIDSSTQGKMKRNIYGDTYADGGMKPYFYAMIHGKTGNDLHNLYDIVIEKDTY